MPDDATQATRTQIVATELASIGQAVGMIDPQALRCYLADAGEVGLNDDAILAGSSAAECLEFRSFAGARFTGAEAVRNYAARMFGHPDKWHLLHASAAEQYAETREANDAVTAALASPPAHAAALMKHPPALRRKILAGMTAEQRAAMVRTLDKTKENAPEIGKWNTL